MIILDIYYLLNVINSLQKMKLTVKIQIAKNLRNSANSWEIDERLKLGNVVGRNKKKDVSWNANFLQNLFQKFP